MKKNKLAITLSMLLLSASANAGMVAVEAGVMDWDGKAEQSKGESPFVKIKGATGSEFGDVYAHLVLEDVDDNDLLGSEINIIGQINIGATDFNWYGQVFNKQKPTWSETNTFLGGSWDKGFDNGVYAQVALAAHVVTSDYEIYNQDANGFNGGYFYMTLNKGLEIGGQQFSINWWQEHMFGFNDDYKEFAMYGESHGFNGKLTAKWHIDNNLTAALAYRYADNNLGIQGYHDALFYSMQYNF
ncbi:hypothetical protein [Ferrimonas lipolytica]|uniref:Nucleoside-specific channel-forming protein, Tsx n=1 Tax=Ferrimonas lipolytica TaxID=2724191 RepID=A0A6H1UGC9_9GAMM|nr:hypothetical protein [Ferrimonas lipolytica]QIZ78141.1 hypothetical protein HER31_15260 [Ferrimonas lipolytica]